MDSLPEMAETTYSRRVSALVIGSLAAIIMGGVALSAHPGATGLAHAQSSADQQAADRAQLRPFVSEVRECMRVVLRTLHDIHRGEPLTGNALTAYIHGPLSADVSNETLICDRSWYASMRHLHTLRPPVRAVAQHAVIYEGVGAGYGRWFIYAVTLPTLAQRNRALAQMNRDGTTMTRELRAFITGVYALTGLPNPQL